MLIQAAKDHGIDLCNSWMVGDGLNDIQAGTDTGSKTILVAKLKLDQVEHFFTLQDAKLTAIAADLRDALKIIRAASKSRNQRGGS